MRSTFFNRRELLQRRWQGIRTALRRYCLVGAPVVVLGAWFGWDGVVILGVTVLGMGVWDAAARSLRTLFLASALDGPVRTAAVTRHYRSRYKLPNLEVAGLWPSGTVDGGEPPMSVRVEDVGEPLEEGRVVEVRGNMRPGGWVVLVAGGQAVWPLRRVRRGLHPSRLGPYPLEDDDESD